MKVLPDHPLKVDNISAWAKKIDLFNGFVIIVTIDHRIACQNYDELSTWVKPTIEGQVKFVWHYIHLCTNIWDKSDERLL